MIFAMLAAASMHIGPCKYGIVADTPDHWRCMKKKELKRSQEMEEIYRTRFWRLTSDGDDPHAKLLCHRGEKGPCVYYDYWPTKRP